MADGTQIASGSGDILTTDELVTLNGAPAPAGHKAARTKMGFGPDSDYRDVDPDYPLPVFERENTAPVTFGTITTAGANLFAPIDTTGYQSLVVQVDGRFSGAYQFETSLDGVTYYPSRASAYAADVPALGDSFTVPAIATVPVTGRYIRVMTSPDFVGSITGSYQLRKAPHVPVAQQSQIVDFDTSLWMPMAGRDPNGMDRRLAVSETGQLFPADKRTLSANLNRVGTLFLVDTAGYNSISLHLFGTWSATVTFEMSNDGSNWVNMTLGLSNTTAWGATGGTAASATSSNNIYVGPAVSRFIRIRVSAYTSGTVLAALVLHNAAMIHPAMAQVIATAPSGQLYPLGATNSTNGASLSTLISAATNNLTQLKASAGKLHFADIFNTVASVRYLKIFTLPSASVVPGTTNAAWNFPIAANGRLTLNSEIGFNTQGTGLSYMLTGGVALNDNTAIGAGDLICNFMHI